LLVTQTVHDDTHIHTAVCTQAGSIAVLQGSIPPTWWQQLLYTEKRRYHLMCKERHLSGPKKSEK